MIKLTPRKFNLFKRNEKGQVALFVALIFQVVFIFFAVFINVGLLVHHKINLQHSTDLAAYYGAMKQAELMNAISHVNFQIRQAWKLLAWRYRVFGTFGFQKETAAVANIFPINVSLDGSPNSVPPSEEKCTVGGEQLDSADLPFFCLGHNGMLGWGQGQGNENMCRLNCGHLNQNPSSIGSVPMLPPLGHGISLATSVNRALLSANESIGNFCTALGVRNTGMLIAAIGAYVNEMDQKRTTIQMLGANLSATPERAFDLDGGLIRTGSEKTFENNLTEANLSGKILFSTMNGLNIGDCPFQGSSTDGSSNREQFLTEIKLRVVQFFVHTCSGRGPNINTGPGPVIPATREFNPISIWNASYDGLNPDIPDISAADRAAFSQVLNNAAASFSLGFEKNPWCQVYYGARAQSEPKIPFLPIGKVRLTAVSFAKPFGGTIGPRYNKTWSYRQTRSDGGGQVDENYPIRDIANAAGLSGLRAAIAVMPNYSNYVGDTRGLKDREVVAAYHDLMLHRQLRTQLTDLNISSNKTEDVAGPSSSLIPPTVWPSFTMWDPLQQVNAAGYDYLSVDRVVAAAGRNSFFRDLEISVLAPNQFDLTYYSIDGDFYNNVIAKIRGEPAGPHQNVGGASFGSILQGANNFGPADVTQFKPDYGNNQTLSGNNWVASRYGVRHQMAVAARVIKAAAPRTAGLNSQTSIFSFIPNSPSTLLTGWTFQNFSTFATAGNNASFPTAGPDAMNTMTFGKCNDAWNRTSSAQITEMYDSPVNLGLPAAQGNCVFGGRSGYSVKMVSPSLLRANAPAQPLGGPGTSGQIINQVDENFLNP